MAADTPQVLTAKVERLAAIIADGNSHKNDGTVSNARAKMQSAAGDVLDAGGSVAAVESIDLPSER